MDMELNSKKLKQFFAYVLALALAIMIVACGGEDSSNPSDSNNVVGSSDSGQEGGSKVGSVCGFKKSDNVWKFSYSTSNISEEYSWIDESTVEFKEFMNAYHMDEDDTIYTDVDRDEFFDRIMERCLDMNDLQEESSSSKDSTESISADEAAASNGRESYDDTEASCSSMASSSSNESIVLSSSSESGYFTFISPMSSSEFRFSSSSIPVAKPCKTDTADNCEYGSLIDERDGQTYKTVKIGSQWWMAENLNYADSSLGIVGLSQCVSNSADSCKKYGRYYSWMIAVDTPAVFSTNAKDCGYNFTCKLKIPARGICPEGWHIPSSTEWQHLFTAMGKSQNAMLAKGFEEFPNATDSYGFSALPIGGYFTNNFSFVGTKVLFWTSTEYSISRSLYWIITNEICGTTDDYSKYNWFSVRCIKDED